jgi:hypothetical protein
MSTNARNRAEARAPNNERLSRCEVLGKREAQILLIHREFLGTFYDAIQCNVFREDLNAVAARGGAPNGGDCLHTINGKSCVGTN